MVALREDLMGPLIRRLWIRHKRSGRNIRQRMESVLPTMTVSSILEEPFAGDPFPGHDRINHSLADLQAVVSQARADWRIALESMKGVYVIHDEETGQRYVGSAYGDTGIWQRWTTYAATLHGGNVGLKALLEEKAMSTTGRICGLRSSSTGRCVPTTAMSCSVSHIGRTCSMRDRWDTTRTD